MKRQYVLWAAALAVAGAAIWFATKLDWMQTGLLATTGFGLVGMAGTLKSVRSDGHARELIVQDREWQARLALLGQSVEQSAAVDAGEEAQPAAGGSKSKGRRVEVTAFAPESCKAFETFRVQVFFHTPAQRDAAQAEAQAFDRTAGARARRPLPVRISKGQTLHVTLDADAKDIVMTRGAPRIEWDGEPVSLDFLVRIERRRGAMTAGFVAIVFVDGKPEGELAFTVAISKDKAAKPALPMPADASVRRFGKVFLSYSRKDLDKVRLIARSFELQEQDYFWDINGLQSGDEWRRELHRRIDEADAFMLMWSQSAKDSVNVREEVERALAVEKDRKLRFLPFPIEGPPPPSPWDIIADRHIGDPIYYGAVKTAQAAGLAAAA